MNKYRLAALTAAICTAATSVSFGAVFADVGNNLKWAESYINDVYNNQIMVGDFNSKNQRVFRGTENMTYSEAASLIYSIVLKSGFTGDVTQMGINRYAMEMNSEGIAEWAKKPVAFCMEKGIINSYDLTKFIENGQNVKITREDMALFLGRILALNSSLGAGTSLTFRDSWAITPAAKPYIELLNRAGIVKGDNNNNFNPKNNITRAEVAVLASKTFAYMKKQVVTNPESGYTQTVGTIVSIYAENGTWVLKLQSADGIAGFVITDAIPVYTNATFNVGAKGLGLGDSVTVFHIGGSVGKINITKDVQPDINDINTPQYSSTLKDKGELISAGEYKIGLVDRHGDRKYYVVARDAKITLNGRSATLRQLSDRIRGDALLQVSIEYNTGTNEAFIVEVAEQKYLSNTEGRIKNINRREITITSGSKSFNYDMADSVSVKYNERKSSLSALIDAFDDLSGNKYIDVELELNGNDEVKAIVAKASNYKENNTDSEKGTIRDISRDEIKIGSKTYDISAKADVEIKVGNDEIDRISDVIELMDEEDAEIYVEIKIEDGEVTDISGYLKEITGTLNFITVSNSSRVRGEMGLKLDKADNIYFNFDSDTVINIDSTEYDSETIDSLAKYINNHKVENCKVQFDDDGFATRVKG